MPLFYLEVQLNDDVLLDEWLWYPNLQAAQCEAEDILTEISSETGVGNVRVLITDQHGQATDILSQIDRDRLRPPSDRQSRSGDVIGPPPMRR